MASDSGSSVHITIAKICIAIVTLCVLSGTAVMAFPSVRLVVLCAMGAVFPVVMIWRALAFLLRRSNTQQEEISVGLPRDQQGLADSVLRLEAQLEHAPIALFSINDRKEVTAVVALNANARRLLAPGRASNIPDLHQQLMRQTSGQRSMLSFETEQGLERALVAASAMTLQGEPQRLVALMPVENELEAEALHAWRQLVHVLTHEIMNSLTPVASLSRTAFDLLDELRPSLPADVAGDLATALDAISRRARGLEQFVSSYRTLSNVPAAKPETVAVEQIFARLDSLLAPSWQARQGTLQFIIEPTSLQMVIDTDQLEQALINLLKNAYDATQQVAQPQVVVSAKLARGGRLRIEVSDNGAGVPDNLIAHIFTPFFTTKINGGGIGLAMVRQLVHGNGGTVRYAKSVGGGARFILTF
jgi:signal transduction histidine kinase